MRRIALDTETVVLLGEHKERCAQRLRELGAELTGDMYVFSNARRFEPTAPCSPHSVSSRYRNLARRLGIDTHIHALRHYSTTELWRPAWTCGPLPDGSVTAAAEHHAAGLCGVGGGDRSQGGGDPRLPDAQAPGPIARGFSTQRSCPTARHELLTAR